MKRRETGPAGLWARCIAAVSARRALALGSALFFGSWLAYVANGRVISGGDSIGTSLVPFALWQDGTLRLDRYIGPGRYPERVYSFYRAGDGHWHNRYPIGASLVAAPLYWPLLFVPDLDPAAYNLALPRARRAEKLAAATLAALAVLMLFDLLRHATTLGRSAFLAALFGLATPMFTVAGQSLLQHGPAVLTLTAALRLLLVGSPGPASASAAGFLAALLVAIRPTDAVFAAPLVLIALRRGRRVSIPFLAAATLGGAALVAYNLSVFDHLLGGYVRFDPAPEFHFSWSALAGLVASPRGILFFCPFLPLLFWRWRRPSLLLPAEIAASVLAVAGSLVIHAGVWSWWGGENYGARYWIDGLPLLFLLGARALDGALSAGRRAVWITTVTWALALQVAGALTFPRGETGYASDLETATWSLSRSPVRFAFDSGLASAELWPLTRFGPRGPLPPKDAVARLRLHESPRYWNREGVREVELEIWNLGASRWSGRGGRSGDFAVRLHSWWRRANGAYYRDSSISLGGAMEPGERRTMRAGFLGPRETGTYLWHLAIAETQAGGYRLFDGPDSKILLRVEVLERETDIRALEAAAFSREIFDDGFETGSASSWSTGEPVRP